MDKFETLKVSKEIKRLLYEKDKVYRQYDKDNLSLKKHTVADECFIIEISKKFKQINTLLFIICWQFSFLQLLKFILNYTALGAMWLYYWDEIIDQITVCRMFWCFTNQKSNIAIAVARHEISYRIYNKITRHSAIPSTWVRSIFLYLAISFPGSLGFLIERRILLSYQNTNMPRERGCVFSNSVKIELL